MRSPGPAVPRVVRRTTVLCVVATSVALATAACVSDAPPAHAIPAPSTRPVAPVTSTGRAVAPGEQGYVTGTVVDRRGNPVAGALVNALEPTEVPEGGAIPDRTDRRDVTGA